MAEETAGAATSTTTATAETKFTQFDGWDEDGTPVVMKKEPPTPKEADAAAADTSKATNAEDAANSAATKKQETHRKPDAEARIKELNARNKHLERELEEARKPKETKPAEASTAKAAETKPATQPQNFSEWLKTFKTKDFLDNFVKENPEASYEDMQLALNVHTAEVREQFKEREQQAKRELETVGQKVKEARERYENYDTVTKPLIADLLKPDISREVFAVLNDSPVLADLLYTIGGTEASKADFLDACRSNPSKALRVALLMEQEIVKELGKGKAEAKKNGEGEAETTPAGTKPRAPKPPAEVGGRGAPGEDALISAAKTGDFRSFEAEQTRRAMASRR
jgi:hypothetical protein